MEIVDGYDPNKMSMLAEKRKLKSSGINSETTQIDGAPDGGDKDSDLMTSYIELSEAKQRLRLLEMKIQTLENRLSKKYPDVRFLNYKNRKRILVRRFLLLFHVFMFPKTIKKFPLLPLKYRSLVALVLSDHIWWTT